MQQEDITGLEVIEHAVAQNLREYVGAVQQVAPELRAAAIACAGGTAAFLGSDTPLTTVKGAGPEISDEDFDRIESFFRAAGLETAVFELAPWISKATALRLSRRGYHVAGAENVVVRDPPYHAPPPSHRVVSVDRGEWPALMRRMYGIPEVPHWQVITAASSVLPGAIRLGVLDSEGFWIGCAELLPVAGVGLFANDATLSTARRRGVQTALIHARLFAATEQFSCVAAEVSPGSDSERNYLRCGFHLAYSRTHYERRIV